MNTTKITHVAHLVEICVQHGVSKVVISPGSRNAPLIIAFDAHPQIEIFVIHDERSAAFFAMGMAEKSGEPVAITCTSGSAAINYAPAISEAYYRNIPLLVLTADRPIEWVDQGDGQTIRQKNLYRNFIKADFELPNFPKDFELRESDKIANKALNTLNKIPKGPVHLNIPLSEPLYDKQDLVTNPIIQIESELKSPISTEDLNLVYSNWIKSDKKMILIGQMPPDEISLLALAPFFADSSTAILVENTSNVQDFMSVCHCIDRTLALISEDELDDFRPDLLVTIGGAIVSKKIKSFLRTNKPNLHYRVGEYLFEENTYLALTKSINCSSNYFFKSLGECDLMPNSNFGNKWKQRDFMAQERHEDFLESLPFSDLKAFEFILNTLPEKTNLHLANSSVIRYTQLFNPASDISYFSNRGVSGIDGSTSTALGMANVCAENLNVLISGDTSFFYDSNALWNSYLPSNFRIIVINNGGGGIFKIIDGPNQSDQRDLFVAEFEGKIKSICEAFNVHHLIIDSLDEIHDVLNKFYTMMADDRPVLLEIITKGIPNETYLKAYFETLRIGNPQN